MAKLITQPEDVADAIKHAPSRPQCRRLLLAAPDHFTVKQAINPWMQADDGGLNEVDPVVARQQWTKLRRVYEELIVRVDVIPAPTDLPDFCFAANQSLAFLDARLQRHAILSRMTAESRRDEVRHFEDWYKEEGFEVHSLPETVGRFEGTGDAIHHPLSHLYWGGIGPRTDETAWPEVARITGADVIPLKLTDETFYHLDTCFCVIDGRTALYVPDAFDGTSRKLIDAGFRELIAVSDEDAANFACNAHSPDGRHVLIQKGSAKTVQTLRERGFEVIEVETGEFMKSGGSVFCLKQELP